MVTKWFVLTYATYYTHDQCQFGWKWKWKIPLYHPFLLASQNKWKCNYFCDLEGGS